MWCPGVNGFVIRHAVLGGFGSYSRELKWDFKTVVCGCEVVLRVEYPISSGASTISELSLPLRP